MPNTAGPARQIDSLQQCLSSDKRPLALFIGAGCPMSIRVGANGDSPLIPDIVGITAAVRTKISASKKCLQFFETIEDNLKHDGVSSPTIEDILSHVRALRAAAGKDKARGLSAAELDSLDEEICGCIQTLADTALPDRDTAYHRIAAWADAIARDKPIEIFTSNYDLLIEQALEECRVPYFDGFSGSRRPIFDPRSTEEDTLPPRWTRLWKLHGSINWYETEGGSVFRGATNAEQGAKRVIHPSHHKYDETRRLPYLAMMDRLIAFFRHPAATLVACGYSFRDKHINDALVRGLQATPTAVAFGLCFGARDQYPTAVRLARERTNLSIIAKDGAVVGGQEIAWAGVEAEARSDSKWIRWVPEVAGATQDKYRQEFLLGEFSYFGAFLQELTGRLR